MVRFSIGEVEVFFPYDYVYPEQYEYMRYLKTTLDAKGHCVLEMPTGTGKTVALLSLITSYQFAHPEVGKLIYCTRTVPEMEKALYELKTVIKYRTDQLENDSGSGASALGQDFNGGAQQVPPASSFPGGPHEASRARRHKARNFLGIGMASRRNLCIHPSVMEEANRDKVDEKCQALTAPWIRRKRLMTALASSQQRRAAGISAHESSDSSANVAAPTVGSVGRNDHSDHQAAAPRTATFSSDIEDGGLDHSCCASGYTTPHAGSVSSGESVNTPSRPAFCPFYESYESLWSPSLLPSGAYTIGDMKRFGETWRHPSRKDDSPAPFCPYFASRRLLQVANVVVLNYQYILDPRVSQVAFMGKSGALGGGSSDSAGASNTGKDPSIVVFDEAHNIDNVCIEAFSVNLNMMTLERARQNIEKLKKEVTRAKSLNASNLLLEYERLVHNLRDEGHLDDLAFHELSTPILSENVVKEAVPGTIRRAEFFLVTIEKLLLFLNGYIRVFTVKTEGPLSFLKRVKDDTSVDSKTLRFYSERLKSLLNTLEVINLEEFSPLTLVADFFTLLGSYWQGFILITDPYPEAEGIYDPLIQLSCLDSSLAMKPVLEKFQSVILTSGTISPLFLYPKLLGFQPVITQSLPMSLDRNCICPLIVVKGADQVPLSSKFDLRSDHAVLRNFGTLLTELAKTVPDGIVCFFTSYAFMELVVAEWYRMGVLAEVMQYKLILMETKDVVATTLALHSYRQACDCGRGAVFFSVARGKVAEGIDFDRHYGRAVVLFGVPYQYTLSRILKARLDFMRDNYQIPENEFLTFDAMRQAAQCVGRVIRSKTDYGLMIFADSRYSRADKRQKLPDWILRHLDGSHMALSTDAALAIARRFLLDMSQPLSITGKSRLDKDALERLHQLNAPSVAEPAPQQATVKEQSPTLGPASEGGRDAMTDDPPTTTPSLDTQQNPLHETHK